MAKKIKLRPIVYNNKAISEEFTTLPALSVVMIGFTLFFILIANVYNSYDLRAESLEKYQTADFIVTKLTNPDCYFIKEGGLVDLPILKTVESDDALNAMRDEYRASGVDFIIRINWDGKSKDFPEELSNTIDNRVAVSRDAGIYINEAQTKPGKLTVITWSYS